MNKHILTKEVQNFIIDYSDDISKLAFTGSSFKTISVQELIQQIESRRKSEIKMPLWYSTNNIYYPSKIQLEQTSSEITANYKASLVQGKSLADITGGFGVDSYYFSENIDIIHHFEKDQILSDIASYNFKVFEKNTIECFNKDGIQAVCERKYDIIYADPSRRHDSKGKVFFLNDCMPNIPKNLDVLLDQCNQMLIKTSPMLDITKGLIELKHVLEIHIVAINNEVKELLWLLDKKFAGSPEIKTINFTKNDASTFNFNLKDKAKIVYNSPKLYLYEPNAAILKSGGFDLISDRFKINKLHKHTHLFTSEKLVDFPGRSFKINKAIPYHKKDVKALLFNTKANITTRNFTESVASLRKRWKIKDGGSDYLFFTTLENDEKVILVCSKT